MSRDSNECREPDKNKEEGNPVNYTTMSISDETPDSEAIVAAIANHVAIYDCAGQLVQLRQETLRETYARDLQIVQDSLATGKQKPAPTLFDEHGSPLPVKRSPVQRMLNGEVLKSVNAADVQLRWKDGREAQISVSGAPVLDKRGQVIGAVAIILDVTEQRKQARTLQKLLDTLLTMVDALVQDNAETQTLAASAYALYMENIERTVEQRLLELLFTLLHCQLAGTALLDSETSTLHVRTMMSNSSEYTHSGRVSLQDMNLSSIIQDTDALALLRTGEVLFLDLSLISLRKPHAYTLIVPLLRQCKLIGILLLVYGTAKPQLSRNEVAILKSASNLLSFLLQYEKEQTEKEKALASLHGVNEDLERFNKMKSNFVATVSQEFRAALTGIQGFSAMIRDQDLALDTIKELATDISADVHRLARMINDMLDLERMESGSVQLNLEWLNLNAIISDVISHMRPTTSNCLLRQHLAKALPILLGDKEKLTQVIVNLLHNAIEYSPDGGEIGISTLVEGNLVHVRISDQGIGIAPAELERIFERYARAESSVARYVGVSGLGLPIAREIIQMHGGKLWGESVPGKGSVFHFTVRFADT